MKLIRLSLALWLALAQMAQAEPVTFSAADGVIVEADFQGTGTRPLILLFHMAGSNRHEYDGVADRLQAEGYDTLAVDQRSGGSAFGHSNATAALTGQQGYLDAYPDLEAALAWAVAQGAPKIMALGSSYSSSLVFLLAADHPDEVAAILAFSPGEYFADSHMVRNAAQRVRQPVFATSASTAGEEAEAAGIVAALPGPSVHLMAKAAPHGASALRKDANRQGHDEIWQAVLGFLRAVP